MSEFTLLNLRILDNGDGVFRLGRGGRRIADEIHDAEGRVVASDSAEVRTLLATLGIGSLQGLRLSPASQYLASLAQAEAQAQSGRTPEARRLLETAREWARQARLAFNEARAEQILVRSTVAELGQLQAEATQAAEAGNLTALEDARQAARDVLVRLGTPLENWESSGLPFAPSVARNLEIRALRQARTGLLERATRLAESGDLERSQEALARYREYHARAGDALSESAQQQIQAVETRAYRQASTLALSQAAEAASQGNLENFRRFATRARDLGRLGNAPLTAVQEARLRNLETEALAASANRLLDRLETRIRRAAEREEEIDIDEVRVTLQSSREQAQLSGRPWSSEQAARAERLRSEAYQANLAYRFRQAREAAAQGKVDDTLVPLRAAREMAAQARIPFDEVRASGLLHQAMVQGVELSFRNATCFALSLDEANARIHLETARDYCQRLHQIFPEERAREVLALVRRSRRLREAGLEENHCSNLLHNGMSYWPAEESPAP